MGHLDRIEAPLISLAPHTQYGQKSVDAWPLHLYELVGHSDLKPWALMETGPAFAAVMAATLWGVSVGTSAHTAKEHL